MRRLTGLVVVMALVGALAWRTDAVVVVERLLGPVYDTVTVASMRNLATALNSRAITEGDLDDVTVPELRDWGWEPAETTAVVIWVDGDRFRAEARDVRPGASTFAVVGIGGPALEVVDDDRADGHDADDDVTPGVRILPADL